MRQTLARTDQNELSWAVSRCLERNNEENTDSMDLRNQAKAGVHTRG